MQPSLTCKLIFLEEICQGQGQDTNIYLPLSALIRDRRWIECVQLRNLRSETIADGLISFFCTFGFPRLITSDNMSSFKSDLWTLVRAKLGIDARFSAPWHFMSHGLVERANRSIEDILKKYIHSQPKNLGQTITVHFVSAQKHCAFW